MSGPDSAGVIAATETPVRQPASLAVRGGVRRVMRRIAGLLYPFAELARMTEQGGLAFADPMDGGVVVAIDSVMAEHDACVAAVDAWLDGVAAEYMDGTDPHEMVSEFREALQPLASLAAFAGGSIPGGGHSRGTAAHGPISQDLAWALDRLPRRIEALQDELWDALWIDELGPPDAQDAEPQQPVAEMVAVSHGQMSTEPTDEMPEEVAGDTDEPFELPVWNTRFSCGHPIDNAGTYRVSTTPLATLLSKAQDAYLARGDQWYDEFAPSDASVSGTTLLFSVLSMWREHADAFAAAVERWCKTEELARQHKTANLA